MDKENFYEDYWKYREEINHLYEEWTPFRLEKASDLIISKKFNKILDVGCGEGTLGRLLKEKDYEGYEIYGMDISKKALRLANPFYDKTVSLDIEERLESSNFPPNDFPESYDCVVILEVLEHIFKPKKILKSLKKNLSSTDGYLLTSVPNFVFYKHRLDILLGKYPREYTLYGSAEHIQHFTIESFRKLLINAGYTIKEEIPDIKTPLIIPKAIGNLAPSLFAQQYLALAKPQNQKT